VPHSRRLDRPGGPRYRRCRIFALTLLTFASTWSQIAAQEKFPSGPVEMIIPTPPGGGTDIAFRQLAEIAEQTLGTKIVVTNKPGGSGAVGMSQVINAKPDGHTIGGLWNAPLTMTPHLLAVPYSKDDYATIGLSTWAPAVLCVRPEFPAADGKGMVEALQKSPGKLTYGNDGVGGTMHLAVERIFFKLGLKARAVPFGGAGDTLKAFLGGHIDIYAGSISPVLPHAKSGTVKCLLMTSAEKSDVLPAASTLADVGIPNEGTVLWRGVIAPKGVAPDRLAVLERAFQQAAQSDRFKSFMVQRGELARGTTGKELRALIDSEDAAIQRLVAAIGLKQQ
jgi:tripartite-type tricarboxylate transporter receptor subunit TctC